MRVSFFDSTWELVQLTMMIPSILSAAGKDWEQLAAGAAEVQEVGDEAPLQKSWSWKAIS